MEKNALTAREIRILNILCDKAKWKSFSTGRHSDKEFDVDISVDGNAEGNDVHICASMYLAIIQNVNWKDKRIWELTDAYGDKGYIPSQGYDWSGIRDSSIEAVWKMTNVSVGILEEEENSRQKKMEDAVKTLGVMLSMFKTRADLIDYVVQRQDSFITHMAAAYVILTDMK